MAEFTNVATLSYNNTVTNSNVTTGQLLEVLSATKTAVVDTYTQADNTAFVVSIVNTGTTAFTGLTLTDTLGAYTFDGTTLYPMEYVDGSIQYYVNGVQQAAPAVTAGPPLQVTGISVPAGGNAMIIYEAQLNQFAPPGTDGSVTNTATIEGGTATPIVVTETITPRLEPRLTISKSLSPTTVTENGQLTYTFVIQNSGNTAAVTTDNVTLTDQFDPILAGLTVTFDGTTWTDPTNYTYDETTGLFATVPGQITVPAATYTQDPTTGAWITTPGVSTLVVTGTVTG